MATLVLTVIGDDQSGLVDALSGVIADHGGNWDESHMSHLAGKFAGIVVATVPDGRATALVDALSGLEDDGLLDVTSVLADDSDQVERGVEVRLELVGQDRPGIVHDISHALAGHGVSILELQTATSNAPMGGGMLFEASALLEVPLSVELSVLNDVLEELANELMVDIDLRERTD